MKLHEALRQIITQFGVSVLGEKRLVYLLSDYRAFEDYPAMRQIMLLIAGKDCLNGLASKGKAVSRREAERAARDLQEAPGESGACAAGVRGLRSRLGPLRARYH